jgi:hypothetical protein
MNGLSALHRSCRRLAPALAALSLITALGVSTIGAEPPGGEQGRVTVTIPIGEYAVTQTARGQEVLLNGFGSLLVPGKPKLPSRIFAIAIPPGAEMTDMRIETGDGVELAGAYDIAPAPLVRVIGDADPAVEAGRVREYERTLAASYGSDDPYPAAVAEVVRTAGYRHYNLVDVRITPFTYRAKSRRLTFHPDVTVHIDYALGRKPAQHSAGSDASESTASEIVLNYEQACGWCETADRGERGLHDFVIVTIDGMTMPLAGLVDWETQKGRNVEVVTTSWIDANYPGYDLAERIRNFLREKYPADQWGIEDVLLVGHYNDLPMRRTEQNVGYGRPETDFYYAELSLPDSESWDADGDHRWGEDSDPIDFYAEVNVGRIPWSDPSVVTHVCQKSIAYEQSTDPAFKKNILLLGAFFWDDDPNPRTDNAVLMEAKVDQPWMADWTMTRLYEQGYSDFPMDYNLTNANVANVWCNNSFAFVNWAGHGSPWSSHILHGSGEAFIHVDNCPDLNDAYPAIIFADACSNSDTDEDNIGREMIRQGGVGFVGATKVAFGMPAWDDPNDGSSQSLDYFFTTCVTSGEYTQGAALQWAMREMYQRGLWGYTRYETFEWGALWGNPDLGMGVPAAMQILLPGGVPETIDPGVPTSISVEIRDGIEHYLPGTGMLHYRDDGGAYEAIPLVPLGEQMFEATLPPAACSAAPEFYFSAETEDGTLVTNPADAPDTVYDAIVGWIDVIWSDNFEFDAGWTVENSPDLTDGAWERGIPAGGGDRGDPPTDFDGSGQCYLTDNVAGNSDVDGGTTWLYSPVFNAIGGDRGVSFALWYTNYAGDNPHADLFHIHISNDGGSSWTLVETVGPHTSPGWTEHEFRIADFITPTDAMMLRFEASDLGAASVVEAGVDAVSVWSVECEDLCVGDLNDDFVVNVMDLLMLLDAWGNAGGEEDLTDDDVVNVLDLLVLLDAWGDC